MPTFPFNEAKNEKQKLKKMIVKIPVKDDRMRWLRLNAWLVDLCRGALTTLEKMSKRLKK